MRYVEIRLDGVVVFKGDVARADGSSLSTTVWFTADAGVRARVEASDPRRSATPKASTMGKAGADRSYEDGVPGANISPDTASAHAFFDDDGGAAAASGGYGGGGGARGRAGVGSELEAHPLLQDDDDDDGGGGGGGGGGALLRWGGFLDVGAGGGVMGMDLAADGQAGGSGGAAVTPRPRTGARSRGAAAGLGARGGGGGGEGSVRGLRGLGVSQSVTSLSPKDPHTGSRMAGDLSSHGLGSGVGAGVGGDRDGLSSGAPVRPSTAASLRRQRPMTCKVLTPLYTQCTSTVPSLPVMRMATD